MSKLKEYLESPANELEQELKTARDEELRLAQELDAARLRVDVARKAVTGRIVPPTPGEG